ncbi:DUF192 domain-containing protein [Candidatus Woesearchaeota archaeon]|nr:DUF192 domain-containing protein [Candidatus Woesearchaeota archaeon]
MPVKNVTRNTIIASRSKIADSALGRAVGLMFSKPTQAAMVLKFAKETPISLHTFFVFFPIDIILADSALRVVGIVKGMPPFSTYSADQKAKFVVEVPSGTRAKSKTRVGDRLTFLRIVEKRFANGRRITVSRA